MTEPSASRPDEGRFIEDAIRRGLTPDPALTVSEWADRHRVLAPRSSAEPGRYRTARTPYMREIMDALSPSHPARRVVFIKAAQVGATEAGNNWVGYVIHHVPGPMLVVQPTVELAKRYSRQRIDPLIEATPALRERIRPARSRDSGNTLLSKEFDGGILVMTGANSAVGLRSMPARWVFLDEVDAYPGDADGEGDPIALVQARTRTFGHRAKIFLVSTPTIQGVSRIEREYEASDKRRFFVPCPECGHMQPLVFERLRWERGAPETAAYVCAACEATIDERHKGQMLAAGEWRPTADAGGIARAATDGVVGYHISALYSPPGWQSWADIAREWEAALTGGDDAVRAFKNTVLGETWRETGDAPEWQRVYERRRPARYGVVPSGGLVITAGVDVQKDRLEVSMWAWGKGLQSWLVDHAVIEGSPGDARTWSRLDALLDKEWSHEGGGLLRVARVAVDTGYDTSSVYAWSRRRGFADVMPVKGVDRWDTSAPVAGPTYVDATVGGRRIRRGARLWRVAVSTFKAETYRWLRLEMPTDEELAEGDGFPPGTIHLPDWVDGEYCRQLTAEQLVTVRNRRGFTRLEWQKIRERNEALDCRVYARAAAWALGMDRWDDERWERETARVTGASAKKSAPADDGGSGRAWINIDDGWL